MNPIPYAASILWGALTAVGLWLLTVPLSLGEMGGPTDWATVFIIVTVLMLAVAASTVRAKGALSGAICSLLFSLPIAAACFLVAHSSDTIRREHGGQLWLSGFAAVAVSGFVMSAAGYFRTALHSGETKHKKF